jgi:hypothetical protein
VPAQGCCQRCTQRWRSDISSTCQPAQGVTNFALYSTTATEVELVFLSEADLAAGRVTAGLVLDPLLNRTGDVWHVAVPSVNTALLYGAHMFGLLLAHCCTCRQMRHIALPAWNGHAFCSIGEAAARWAAVACVAARATCA